VQHNLLLSAYICLQGTNKAVSEGRIRFVNTLNYWIQWMGLAISEYGSYSMNVCQMYYGEGKPRECMRTNLTL